MKKRLQTFMLVLLVATSLFLATALAHSTTPESKVKNIKIWVEDNIVHWKTDGFSSKGFKVVWSKNPHPTYPPRSGDKYHYFSDPYKEKDSLSAFDGEGTYYVRVCEYLGGKCGTYSNEEKIELKEKVKKEEKCFDSDGKDYYKKGKVIPLGKTEKIWDVCDGSTLLERTCGEKGELKTLKYLCPNGCSDGACLKVKPTDETGPVELPDLKPELCSGCFENKLCYPLGYRKSGKFCSDTKNFTEQKTEDEKCDNNFECKSNLCVSNKCVGQSLIQKILNWLKSFFS